MRDSMCDAVSGRGAFYRNRIEQLSGLTYQFSQKSNLFEDYNHKMGIPNSHQDLSRSQAHPDHAPNQPNSSHLKMLRATGNEFLHLFKNGTNQFRKISNPSSLLTLNNSFSQNSAVADDDLQKLYFRDSICFLKDRKNEEYFLLNLTKSNPAQHKNEANNLQSDIWGLQGEEANLDEECGCAIIRNRPKPTKIDQNWINIQWPIDEELINKAFEGDYIGEKLKLILKENRSLSAGIPSIYRIIMKKRSILAEKEQQQGPPRPIILGIILKHPHKSLNQEYQSRKLINEHFSEGEIWTILFQALNALEQYEKIQKDTNLRILKGLQMNKSSVFIGKDGSVVISDIHLTLTRPQHQEKDRIGVERASYFSSHFARSVTDSRAIKVQPIFSAKKKTASDTFETQSQNKNIEDDKKLLRGLSQVLKDIIELNHSNSKYSLSLINFMDTMNKIIVQGSLERKTVVKRLKQMVLQVYRKPKVAAGTLIEINSNIPSKVVKDNNFPTVCCQKAEFSPKLIKNKGNLTQKVSNQPVFQSNNTPKLTQGRFDKKQQNTHSKAKHNQNSWFQQFSSIPSQNISSQGSNQLYAQIMKTKSTNMFSKDTREWVSAHNFNKVDSLIRSNHGQLLQKKLAQAGGQSGSEESSLIDELTMSEKYANEGNKMVTKMREKVAWKSSHSQSQPYEVPCNSEVREWKQKQQYAEEYLISQIKRGHKKTLSQRNRQFLQNLIEKQHQNMILEVPESEFDLESRVLTLPWETADWTTKMPLMLREPFDIPCLQQ